MKKLNNLDGWSRAGVVTDFCGYTGLLVDGLITGLGHVTFRGNELYEMPNLVSESVQRGSIAALALGSLTIATRVVQNARRSDTAD